MKDIENCRGTIGKELPTLELMNACCAIHKVFMSVGYKIPSAEVLDRIDPPRTPPAFDRRWYLFGLLRQSNSHSAD